MPDRKLIRFNFMDDYGDGNITPKQGNPYGKGSHVSLDLSLSLGYMPLPSSAATEKYKESSDQCTKKLVTSDLSDMLRLLLAKNLVESHILPHWDIDRRSQIHIAGVHVSVYDCETNNEYAMDFKRWRNGAYVFIKKWISNFMNRRDLKLNDEIGIYWDILSSRFNFSVLNHTPCSNYDFQVLFVRKQVFLFNF
ncbi:hypothetical protein V6N13_132112 [Hibiscus sabdariffa]|uniref:Uncharacterized protein n=2 Tax=Hibiscus sabdariffa TaxID=183260 RepID=A0ABR2BAD5_9ROSI